MQTKNGGVELKINSLEKSFGNLKVLQNIDLTINKGEFVAIVGKSGCGKSTLLRHVAGLEMVTAGSIEQDKTEISGLNQKARVMFQDARILPWKTVLENVGIGLALKKGWKDHAGWALEQVGLSERANDWPSVLSGGQKQRVSLARALAARPELLLLDEPLGALDAFTRIEMQELIEKIWEEQGFTALLVTHDVTEAITLANRVVLIENGRITLNVAVPLERPRNRMNPLFVELEQEVLAAVLGKSVPEKRASEIKVAMNG